MIPESRKIGLLIQLANHAFHMGTKTGSFKFYPFLAHFQEDWHLNC